jgi:hypothetical protein
VVESIVDRRKKNKSHFYLALLLKIKNLFLVGDSQSITDENFAYMYPYSLCAYECNFNKTPVVNILIENSGFHLILKYISFNKFFILLKKRFRRHSVNDPLIKSLIYSIENCLVRVKDCRNYSTMRS